MQYLICSSLQFFNVPIDNCVWGLLLIWFTTFDNSANHSVFSAVVPAETYKIVNADDSICKNNGAMLQ